MCSKKINFLPKQDTFHVVQLSFEENEKNIVFTLATVADLRYAFVMYQFNLF